MAKNKAMTVRERTAEYATLKALGFGPLFLRMLIYGEALAIAGLGGILGIALTFPVADAFGQAMGTLFPVFIVSDLTVVMQAICALLVGIVSAVFPARSAARVNIVDGLRSMA
jgi:putative ABC transport system permease protein